LFGPTNFGLQRLGFGTGSGSIFGISSSGSGDDSSFSIVAYGDKLSD